MATDFCIQCGKPFTPRTSIHKLCSKKCRSKYYKLHPRGTQGKKKKTCIECGRKFYVGVASNLCSHECQAKHKNILLPDDPWQRGKVPPVKYAEDLFYTPSFGAGF